MSGSGPLIDCEVTNFIRGANPVWSMVDLDGKQMDDTFYLWVLQNEIPYNIATVYHDPSGTIPWGSPIQFLANGTLPIDIYFANHTIYRLEIRQNLGLAPPSQADPLIYLIPDYNPSQSVDIPTNVEGDATENQISNAQFSVVNFDGPTTYTNLTGSVEVAPGWFLDLTGLGNVTVEQVAFGNANSNPTNAPYALRLTIGGPYVNAPVLRQRFQQNGMNWANKTVASSFTALIGGAMQVVDLTLTASNGAALATLQTQTLSNSFAEYRGFATLGASPNPDIPPDAYIDFNLILPTSGDVYVTSFQLVVSDNAVQVPYQQDTIDRQIDHLFHYYKDKLAAKPIPSYLVGWDFPMNPSQFYVNGTRAAQAIGANKSEYKWDQTIVFQEVNSGVGVTRNALSGGFTMTAALAGQFAMIQYLDADLANEILSGNCSVFIEGFTNLNEYDGVVSLWATTDPTLPVITAGTNNSLVTALNADGKAVCGNGTWVEVPRSNFGNASFTLNAIKSSTSLNGWAESTLAGTATFFAIVIGFESVTATEAITITRVGLCAGDIPTRPAPKTHDETLRDCERYYEKSYETNVAAGTVTAVGTLIAPQGSCVPVGALAVMVPNCFGWEFRSMKRSLLYTPAIYSPITGTIDRTDIYVLYKNVVAHADTTISTQWTVNNKGSKFVNYAPTVSIITNGSTPTAADVTTIPSFNLMYHYIVDARLGIVN